MIGGKLSIKLARIYDPTSHLWNNNADLANSAPHRTDLNVFYSLLSMLISTHCCFLHFEPHQHMRHSL